jgi:3-dehydrotetronate 4-kinase
LGAIAQGLIAQGIRQLVIAGGETSGACVQALGITRLRIGPQIDPGVPWCFASASDGLRADLHIALKSGNFGAPDFFAKSFKALQ